jgi:beta-lactamase superfamily II metal-dependent hydrolase
MAALTLEDDDVYVRVVDVGPGLCAVIRAPDDHFMVFDAGHWNGQHCINAVRELVTGDSIDLMVISHSDADHLGDAARILGEKRVRQTILAGEVRDTASWRSLVDALAEEVKEGGSVHNLQSVPLVPGTTLPLGEAIITLVAGWPVWTDPGPTESERRNAISVVVRLDYRSRSVLFTGDTVGRRLADLDDACKDAEKVMVDRHNAGQVSLKSDVLIASHHGGNNGSAKCFIQAIDPQFVIFSAGHDHQHPTHAAATRFLTHGLSASRLFRTDFGDDEAGAFEWKVNSVTGCSDPAGDDDVEIALRAAGTVEVDYLRTASGCDSRAVT